MSWSIRIYITEIVWISCLGFYTRPSLARLFPHFRENIKRTRSLANSNALTPINLIDKSIMTASILPSQTTQSQVKVNVRLCGSIPRLALSESLNIPPSLQTLPLFPSTSKQNNSTMFRADVNKNDENEAANKLRTDLYNIRCQQQASSQPTQTSQPQHNFYPGTTTSSRPLLPTTYEAPSWAVPARGEARLEVSMERVPVSCTVSWWTIPLTFVRYIFIILQPVCDSVNRFGPVDLTSRAVFRIGRSPQSDVPLMHVTSSRRHAMLFHHTNGSSYLVDCGSAHGTYINGVRVTSTPNDSNVVVPTRVRRGSIIRFGGPGAPSFMLKSFSFDLEEMRECPVPTVNMVSSMPPTPILSAMVQHNTRLNSLGRTAKEELMVHSQISSKRSFDSMSTVMDSDDEMEHLSSNCLRSPPLSPEQPLRLVSPELNCACDVNPSSFKRRRVTFSEDEVSDVFPYLVSPDVSSDELETENECCSE